MHRCYTSPAFFEVISLLRAIIFLPLPLLAQLAEQKVIPKVNPYRSASDVARGKRIFLGHCAPCHGPEGEGGNGANLALPTLSRGADDAALFKTIQDGIPGTEMPRASEMNDHEVWQVAAFVRTLGRVTEREKLSGNVSQGRELVRSKGNCLRCHVVAGEGFAMGPELTTIGLRRNAAFLRRTLLDPKTSIPAGYVFVEVVTNDNQQITGIRLTEDTYTIQVRDLSGHLHSFWKSDLSEFRKDPTRTPMPSFQTTLSDSEREDVIAYLVTLRGSQ